MHDSWRAQSIDVTDGDGRAAPRFDGGSWERPVVSPNHRVSSWQDFHTLFALGDLVVVRRWELNLVVEPASAPLRAKLWKRMDNICSVRTARGALYRSRGRFGFNRVGEHHFRHAVAEYVEHYHRERNHQGLDNRLIADTPTIDKAGRVQRRPRLGGLLNFYERVA